MEDTTEHVKKIQRELWLKKTPGERLYQAINDIDAMRHALREAKKKLGFPLGDLDPVGEYLKKKKQKEEKPK